MSKLLPFLVAGVGASSVSVGGVFMLKKTGGNGVSEEQRNNTQSEAQLSADLGFKTLETFKSNKGGECAKKYLGEFGYEATGKSSADISLDASFFPTDGSVNSCLVINWEKTESTASGNKWKGEFSWLWTLVKGKKAMVAFTHYKPHTADNKMIVEGGLYLLKKDGSPEAWQIDKFKEYKSSDTANQKIVESSSFDNSFPKKGEAMKTDFAAYGSDNKNLWGFMKDKDDLTKICKSSGEGTTCPSEGTQQKSFKGSWIWEAKTEESNTLNKWGTTPLTTLCHLYGVSGSSWTDPFTSIKGVWKESSQILVTGQ